MSEIPFNDPPLRLSGLTPIVETDESGSELVRLAEQTLLLPGEITRRGTLILGLPGSGKTTRLLERGVASALSHPEASVVVFAVQPGSARQAWAAFQHHRSASPTRPALFNAGDAAACTHFINPIAGVRARSEAMAIGETLAQPTRPSTGGEEYFLQQASTMIGHSILAVNNLHQGKGTLAMIRDAIDGGATSLRTLGDDGASPELSRFAEEILEGNRNSETTLAQMSNCLQWLFHEEARTATSRQELDFDRLLLKRPGLLVLSVNEEEIPRQRALTSLIFRNLFAWIIRRAREHGGRLPRPLYIFIDELPAAGRIPEFGLRLTATFRKSNVSVVCAAQCEAQLMEVYGEETAAVLAGFGSRLYVPPIDFSDAERASARSGMIEVANHVTTPEGRLLTSTPLNRPLLLPGDIASPPRDPELGPRILFRLAEFPPFFGYLRATWQVPEEQAINDRAARLHLPRRRQRRPDAPPRPVPAPSAPPTLSDIQGWSAGRISRRYRQVMASISHGLAGDDARAWWDAFVRRHEDEPARILRLAEEIALRSASLDDFFHACVSSQTDDVQAILHYLDYVRAKGPAQPDPRGSDPEGLKPSSSGGGCSGKDSSSSTDSEEPEDPSEDDEEEFLQFLADDDFELDHDGDEDEDEDEGGSDGDDRVPF